MPLLGKYEDYPINYGCLFMGEAIEGINPELGQRVTKEEAYEYARKMSRGRICPPDWKKQARCSMAWRIPW